VGCRRVGGVPLLGFFSVPLVGICGVQAARLPLVASSGEAFFFLHLLLRAANLGSKKQIHYFLPTFVRFEHHLHPSCSPR
jgi:hypothetical protein